MRRRRRNALLATALAGVGILAAGCGSDDFKNDPRPPAPVELTAKIGEEQVIVSPVSFDGAPVGAGLANVTISNQTPEASELTFSGASDVTTDPIVANGVLEFKLDLEQGDYTVAAENPGIRPAEFEVGPERKSAQNDLLLP